jgi:hypothetical protein
MAASPTRADDVLSELVELDLLTCLSQLVRITVSAVALHPTACNPERATRKLWIRHRREH